MTIRPIQIPTDQAPCARRENERRLGFSVPSEIRVVPASLRFLSARTGDLVVWAGWGPVGLRGCEIGLIVPRHPRGRSGGHFVGMSEQRGEERKGTFYFFGIFAYSNSAMLAVNPWR
jgi:hypothetical protein